MTRSKKSSNGIPKFYINFLNDTQKLAYGVYQQHDIVLMIGPAGTGKTFLASAFAVADVLSKNKKKIIITRPVVEAGENLGFLPGTLQEKINPYILPVFDCFQKLVGNGNKEQFEHFLEDYVEIAPIAYMRGRAIVNSEKIITPVGLKPMGEIKVGDYVIGVCGNPIKVTAVYPQGKIPVFEIKFSDRTRSVCCANHLWNTMTLNEKRHKKGFTTKMTKDIMESVKNKYNQKVHRVPIANIVNFDAQPVPFDGYLLGILLGDGHINQSVLITTSDQEIVDECLKLLPENHQLVYRGKYVYSLQSQRKTNLIRYHLKEMGLCGLKSYQKFIPDIYKINSIECRLSVLQGLLDSDGWICKHRSGNCRIQFSSASKKLAQDVMFLVRSLGGMSFCRKREFDDSDSHERSGKIIRHVYPSYVVDIMININPFRLLRKSKQFYLNQKMTKMISSITYVGEEECQCIKVDAEDGLFLTNDFIVTHNTFSDAVCIFDEAQNATTMQLKLFLTRFDKNSKIVITGDPKQSDLRGDSVPLLDVIRRIETVPGVGIVKFSEDSIVRHPLVSEIIKRLEEI